MPLRDPLNQRETRAFSLEFVWPVQPLEGTEQFSGVGHPKSYAVILYGHAYLAVVLDRTNTDRRPLAVTGELEGVGKQLLERGANEGGVGLDSGKRLDRPVYRASFDEGCNRPTMSSTKGPRSTSCRRRSCRVTRTSRTRASTWAAIRSAAWAIRVA